MNAPGVRAWLQDALDDRPQGAYEGRFFAGEGAIFQFLLAQMDRVAELEADIPFNHAAKVFCEKYLDTDADMVEVRVAEHALMVAYRDTAPTLEKTA